MKPRGLSILYVAEEIHRELSATRWIDAILLQSCLGHGILPIWASSTHDLQQDYA